MAVPTMEESALCSQLIERVKDYFQSAEHKKELKDYFESQNLLRTYQECRETIR